MKHRSGAEKPPVVASERTGHTTWQFARANLRYVFRGGLRQPDGHLPPADHPVAEDFVSVCVAAANDSAVDDYVLNRLEELGIRHVRLDFSYGDAEGPPARLLERLIERRMAVMLHLVQPFEAASSMGTSAARDEWAAFVRNTLDRFGDRIERLEIGSTVNRKRWAGYTLDGFLDAWSIAHAEVRSRGIVLAGPNITDFEPPYNIGMLAILAQRGQLPDIHTDNLFSERCTEPERFDHKVLGRRMAALFKFNLVKKARMLQRIGRDVGVERLQSPAAFWTLPRIQRMLPDVEQKQADYLARYMVLCAASGALERAGWGPLICHREGLIDNGARPYPVLERITHYKELEGTTADFRIRPAFDAYAAFARSIPGTRYQAALQSGQGLEVHAFLAREHVMHAIWCINGRAVPMAALYAPEDLASARWMSRDGQPLEHPPTLATESPVYARWPADHPVRLKPHYSGDISIRIHRHGAGIHHYFRDDRWHGAVRAADRTEAELLIATLRPENLRPPPKAEALRHARNAIWTIEDPRTPGARLVVKQPVRFRIHKRLLDRFKPSKALRSWNGASELLRRGIRTAEPVAWIEEYAGKDLTRNWYVCEHVEGSLSVRSLFTAYAKGAREHAGITRESAFTQLSAFLLRMHARGVFFRDLSAGNILVRATDPEQIEFILIDTARARFFDHGLPLRMRIADLVRICNKLDAPGREAFMQRYLSVLGRRFGVIDRLSFHLYDLKVRAKRWLRNGWRSDRNMP